MTNKEPTELGPQDRDEAAQGQTPAIEDDVEGHSLLQGGFQRPPATSRNADGNVRRTDGRNVRAHPNRRGER
ncbi:MAG: hypothetical protein QOH61_2291 [Chloroflexota bacterium]|jgi:hypothetical protein|nr:hypothetical protein [Chloroflexota bacterium]